MNGSILVYVFLSRPGVVFLTSGLKMTTECFIFLYEEKGFSKTYLTLGIVKNTYATPSCVAHVVFDGHLLILYFFVGVGMSLRSGL